jgi:hypothetical protein
LIAVVEAKAEYKLAAHGLQQAKEYAQILGLKFAYSTNGKGIVEFDFLTGKECQIEQFPRPVDLWNRISAKEGLTEEQGQRLLTPLRAFPLAKRIELFVVQKLVQPFIERMPRRDRQLAMRYPQLLLAFPVFTSAHRHNDILKSECFEGQNFFDFNHRLLV